MVSPKEKALLQSLQDHFPLVERPFLDAGRRLGLTEERSLAILKRLHEKKLIRYLGAIFDPSRLGISSVLCCADVPAAQVDRAAAVVSSFPQVSHNYLRAGCPNLWFTLSASSPAALGRLVRKVGREAGIRINPLPALRTFKIDARFFLQGKPGRTAAAKRRGRVPFDRKLVVELNRPFAFVSRPFADKAAACAISEPALRRLLERYLKSGLIRRFGIILGHRQAGLKVNCMVAWAVPSSRVAAAGRLFASSGQITHCYERAAFPGWPYTVYTMVHCRTRRECLGLITRLARASGVRAYKPLFTVKEYKKTKADLAVVL